MSIDWSKAPEGATHWDPVDRNHLRQLGEIAQCWIEREQSWTCKGWQYPDDLSTMPRLIKRPTWDGEGLPPVGVDVEIRNPLGRCIRAESKVFVGHKVRVAAVFKTSSGIDMIAVDGGCDLGCEVFRADMAFPIRTAEQIAAEEREKAVREILSHMRGVNRDRVEMAMSIYDAGYRKQVQP